MSWEPLNLAADEYATRSEPPSIVGLVYAGRRHLVSGLPEAMKTMFALIVGLELIRAGGTFALIDFESGPHATRLMLTELGATLDEISRVWYVEADRPPDAADVDALVESGATLAIIDAAVGAYGVSELDDNKRADAETFGRAWVDPLWNAGVASLLIDHVVKSSEARGKFAIGSERKAGRCDVHLGLETVLPLTRGTRGLVRVVTHKDRPGWLPRPRAAELELLSDPETHRLAWEFRPAGVEEDGDTFRPTVLMERVSEYLSRQAEPVTRRLIKRDVRGKGEYVVSAIDHLVAGGFAAESVGGHGAKLVSFSKTFPDLFPAEGTAGNGSMGTTGDDLFPVPPPYGGNRNSSSDAERERVETLAELDRLEAIAEEWE